MEKIMYAVTYLHKDGFRALFRANQGRNHFNTKKECQQFIKDVKNNNDQETFKQLNINPDTFKAQKIKCWLHGDSKQTIFYN